MNRSVVSILLASVMCWTLVAVSEAPVFGMASRPPMVGSPAPEFTLTDLQGNTRSLSDYRGNVVLVNFWATWCKPCTKEMPAMQAVYDEHRDHGFVVLAVNELEDIERVREHIKQHDHTFPVLMDHDNQVANMYGVVGLPVTVFIDKNGRVHKYIKGGLLTTDLIEETVARLTALAESHPGQVENS